MHLRTFDGVPVSEVGLGCWQLGGDQWGDVPAGDALAVLNASADAGVTFLDTADVYGAGRSEELIAGFLKDRGRGGFFVASKFGRFPRPGMPANFDPKVIREHTENSLKRLGIERLDLLISDVVMQSMDGPTLVRHVRERMPHLPILFMSGYAEEQLRR